MEWVIVFGFILGIVLGSFVKALADRSLVNVSIKGRSYCGHCKHKLAWYDLLPVFSFICSKGQCHYCRTKISINYLLVEIGMGILIGLLFYLERSQFNYIFGVSGWDYLFPTFVLPVFNLVLKIIAICVLVAVFLTDIKSGLIPDRITFPSIFLVLGMLTGLFIYKGIILFIATMNSSIGQYLFPPHSDYYIRHLFIDSSQVWMGLIAALMLAFFFGSLIVLTRGRGMGGGDFKLSIFLGLVFGFPMAILVVLLGFLLGSIASIFLLIFRTRKLGQTIPFGPFLSLGGIITIYWGEEILNWYMHSFNGGSILP